MLQTKFLHSDIKLYTLGYLLHEQWGVQVLKPPLRIFIGPCTLWNIRDNKKFTSSIIYQLLFHQTNFLILPILYALFFQFIMFVILRSSAIPLPSISSVNWPPALPVPRALLIRPCSGTFGWFLWTFFWKRIVQFFCFFLHYVSYSQKYLYYFFAKKKNSLHKH